METSPRVCVHVCFITCVCARLHCVNSCGRDRNSSGLECFHKGGNPQHCLWSSFGHLVIQLFAFKHLLTIFHLWIPFSPSSFSSSRLFFEWLRSRMADRSRRRVFRLYGGAESSG